MDAGSNLSLDSSAVMTAAATLALAPRARRRALNTELTDAYGRRDALIMIVDDEPMVSEVVHYYLQEAGYRNFQLVTDSTKAIEQVEDRTPDVVLLDLMMPKVNGFDILEQLRDAPSTRHLPVIVLTSATDPGVKLQALELGANDILAKPVDASELVLRLRNTLAAKAYQDRLAYQDPVTGSPNARMLKTRLERVLARQEPHERRIALFRIGLDRFKQVNTAYGIGTGDDVLRSLVSRLEHSGILPGHEVNEAMPEKSLMLARLSGDEFVLLVPYRDVVETLPQVAERILQLVAQPIERAGHDLVLNASIGIAIIPEDGEDPDTLLARAGAALAQSKREGGNAWTFSSEEFHVRSRQRLALESDLRTALSSGAFVVHYQPKVNLATGRVAGAEALIRWQHPSRGLIYPDEFISVAEETGMVVDFGSWILHEACRDARVLDVRGVEGLGVSVNVSARQFQDDRFPTIVKQALVQAELDPQRLTLELTESLLMGDPVKSERMLRTLKELGVRLAVDDFGTGYSSLAYLKRFPIDELKVDRSFIEDVLNDPQGAAIVEGVLALAHSLNLSVTAEGIETKGQHDFLKSRGCEAFQGFLHSKPVPIDVFVTLI